MATDKWLDWIVNRRFGGDKKIAEESMKHLNKIRDKVIESASIQKGDTVLDIGAGDGNKTLSEIEKESFISFMKPKMESESGTNLFSESYFSAFKE